ncbi:MAG TPA: MSMEG_4193 family putative phosphomutase [Dermatophilaceae bacterium]|nr:MSMEG_4193 family putative phosphomutase [Dermatophilaceae bacterium]
MATCVVVRHGHSTANAEGLLAGWTPGVLLTERGRAQVAALRARLHGIPIRLVATSPLERCRETAAALTPAGTPVLVDDALGECRYGAWTGRKLADLATDPLWRVVQDDPAAARFPDGEGQPAESMAEMSARVVAAVRRHDAAVEAEHGPHAVWLAVSHGDPIKAVLADALGSGLAHVQRVHVDPASVSVVRWSAGRPMVLATNRPGEGVAELVAAPTDAVPAGDAPVGGGGG